MPDYASMNQCLYEVRAKEVEQMAIDALAEGLIAGMCVVGEDFHMQALKLGFAKDDDYISQLRWGEECERPGSPQEVADAVRKELEAAAPAGT